MDVIYGCYVSNICILRELSVIFLIFYKDSHVVIVHPS